MSTCCSDLYMCGHPPSNLLGETHMILLENLTSVRFSIYVEFYSKKCSILIEVIIVRKLVIFTISCTFAFADDVQIEKRICSLNSIEDIQKNEVKSISRISRDILKDPRRVNCWNGALQAMADVSTSDKDADALIEYFLKGGEYTSLFESRSKSRVTSVLGRMAKRGNDKAFNFLKSVVRAKNNHDCIVLWSLPYNIKDMRVYLAQMAILGLAISGRFSEVDDIIAEFGEDEDLRGSMQMLKDKKDLK